MNKDLEIIKKYYGENMAHLCRELFPSVLEKEGVLSKLLLKKFYPNKLLYDDIVNSNEIDWFKEYILSFLSVDVKKEIDTNKSALELMNEAGYDLFECKTERDIDQFRKYYEDDEELCTFKVGNRLDSCYVFFAVKKDVDSIKREDFKSPERQDEYGTSVISIQFSRSNNNIISIKNRYNHTVPNPDATFSNNLDNIIPGLTTAFKNDYNLNLSNKGKSFSFELDNYVQANNGRFYRYNYEINNKYYCPDNIIIRDFNVVDTFHEEKERYIVFDYFILDLKEKAITAYDYSIDDCFHETIGKIEKVSVKKDGTNKIINIESEEFGIIKLVLDSQNNLIEYKNEKINRIEYSFLYYNTMLKKIELPNVNYIGKYFLHHNRSLDALCLPNVISVHNCCLNYNKIISKISLPKVKEIGYNFCVDNNMLDEINLPNVEVIGSNFLSNNRKIHKVFMPNVLIIGAHFLDCNSELEEIFLPKVELIKDDFIPRNNKICKVFLPNVKIIRPCFLNCNTNLKTLVLPNVKSIGSYFLFNNKSLTNFIAPNLRNIGDHFLEYNHTMRNYIKNMMETNTEEKINVLKLGK